MAWCVGLEILDLDSIAQSFRALSNETSRAGLAEALLAAALAYSGSERGAILLVEGSELFIEADASFPREKAEFLIPYPSNLDFRLPVDVAAKVLSFHETIIGEERPALIDPKRQSQVEDRAMFLCMPLVNQGRTIGCLYLESTLPHVSFEPRCVTAISLLASRVATSFESMRLLEALRETHMWMNKGQQIGRMGSYRWNTRSLLSRGSRECYRIFGLNPDINPVPFTAFRDCIHRDDLPMVERSLNEALRTRSSFRQEYRVIHENGRTLHVVAEGQFDVGPSGDLELEGIITDITERKASEQALADAHAELTRASRLASLGELAGSIVHEINQPLSAINTSAEACLRWLARNPIAPGEARKSAARVIQEGRRASAVVASLKILVRDKRLDLSDVHINVAIQEVLLLIRSELDRAGIILKTDFDGSISSVKADRVQIQQVVLNLVHNAVDAMSTVTDRARILNISSSVADKYVVVNVVDSGRGFDPASKDRLFEALLTLPPGMASV